MKVEWPGGRQNQQMAKQKLKSTGKSKGHIVPALTERFKKIDYNGDDKLQLDELKKQTK